MKSKQTVKFARIHLGNINKTYRHYVIRIGPDDGPWMPGAYPTVRAGAASCKPSERL